MLIDRGAVFLAFHGKQCEQAHDIADDIQASLIPDNELTESNVVGTTWHDNETEEEVIFSTFVCSLPADQYLQKFSSYIVISTGTDVENDRIRSLLENLTITIQKVSAK